MNREIQVGILQAAGRYIRKQMQALEPRFKAIEDRPIFTLEAVLPTVMKAVHAVVAEIPVPIDGKSVTVEELQPVVLQAVKEAVAALPAPKDGQNGTSVAIEQVLPVLEDQVRAHLDALPVPKDGASVALDQVLQALLPDVERLLEGFTAKWALEFERRAQDVLQRAVERIPAPPPGKDGKDGEKGEKGADGHSFEYRGVFKEGQEYTRGNAVTFGGSLWFAQKDAPEGKPGLTGDENWVLAVKRGRDGKDAVIRTIQQPATVKVGS